MSRTGSAVVVAAIFILVVVWSLRSRRDSGGDLPKGTVATAVSGQAENPAAEMGGTGAPTRSSESPTTAVVEERIALADPLNAPAGTIQRDLDTLRIVLEAWRSNFPREGNPVGENTEITASLTGGNRLQLPLIPKGHPAINSAGELCDRWGTPFRFHQISGDKMELRSAGPDRQFGTKDDALLSPP